MRLRSVWLVVVVMLVIAGCNSHPLASQPPAPELEAHKVATVSVVKKLDLLFLVDNSQSMRDEQDSLGRNFPLFMQRLESAGVSDLRVGIISSDFGAGSRMDGDGGCSGRGDAGRLLVKPGCGLPESGDRFLALGPSVPGGRNFTGTLPATFSCLATLGIDGCGYEHQLQSLRYALHGDDGRAFLRADANLGIVLVTDEDDCSGTPDSTLFTDFRAGEEPNLRCATAGHQCGGMPVPAGAFQSPLASCLPQQHPDDEQSRRSRLINVAEMVAHIKAVKAGTGRRVIVSAIFGWDDSASATYTVRSQPVAVGQPVLGLSPICNAGNAWAMPAVRLKAFVDAFGADGSWHSICTSDLGPALTKIGEAIGNVDTAGQCLPAAPVDVRPDLPGLQADCVAVDQVPGAGGGLVEAAVPACSGDARPCWELAEDNRCPGGVRPDVKRTLGAAAEGTVEGIRCAVCWQSGQPGCN